MKTIDLSFELKGLDGKNIAIKDCNIAQAVANELAVSTEGDSIKKLSWAMNLFQKGSIQVDSSDFNKFKEFIEENKNFTILLKGQILEYLDTVK